MGNKQFQETYQSYTKEFEEILRNYTELLNVQPSILKESICYSLHIGGKRLRPVLMFAATKMFGGKPSDVRNFALALELIHTYSLVHDDLPAMDNDDFRRGKPSNHKAYGEGQAILAGDALLNEAYRLCFSECYKGKSYIDAAVLICENAGVAGMIAGQSADLYEQGRNEDISVETTQFIMENKTAKMIVSAVAVPAILYGIDNNLLEIFCRFGNYLGILFQITDDILDVTGKFESLGKTIGKDAQEKKLSSVAMYGLEESRKKADWYCHECLRLLNELPYESDFLKELVQYVRDRQY